MTVFGVFQYLYTSIKNSFFAKVSKDVKKIRQFEEGLLRNYQRYLEILEQTVKGIK